MKFDCSTPPDASDKEKFARMICGVTAGFFAGKLVNLAFNVVKAHRQLDELTTP